MRPDKGRSVVVMDKSDYIAKMHNILCDTSKFLSLGPVEFHDHTAKVENDLSQFLKGLCSGNEISDFIYKRVVPTASSRPRMYGLPKVHKVNTPMRPILSMTGSPQYKVSQWICELLQPVVQKYGVHCVKDSFTFCEFLDNSDVPYDGFMCSFDVVSLFTNVPLDDVIDICAKALYHCDDIDPVPLSESSFRKLLKIVTSGVEFSFNNIMYRQIDGVAMGSPLGPVLANVFLGYCESLIVAENLPCLYKRYVDDTFAYFRSKEEAMQFKGILDNLHPSLKFTCEFEQSNCLSFLDVYVERTDSGFVRSVYRKPTFTGLLTTWDSFCSTRYKFSLVKNMFHRAKVICSPSKLAIEIDNIKGLLTKNGYPDNVITRFVKQDLTPDAPKFGPKKCRVFLRLPWLGPLSECLERQVRSVVSSCYFSVDIMTVFDTVRIFGGYKDVLPTHTLFNVIYQFECRGCESQYVGRTIQRLQDRIKQHVPRSMSTDEATELRPKRGRIRKRQRSCDEKEQTTEETTDNEPRRGRPKRKPPD